MVKILRALPGLPGKERAPIPAQSAWNPPEALLLGSFSFWQGFASVYGGTHSGTRQKPQGNDMDFLVLWTIGPIWANHMTLEWKESLPESACRFPKFLGGQPLTFSSASKGNCVILARPAGVGLCSPRTLKDRRRQSSAHWPPALGSFHCPALPSHSSLEVIHL